MERTRRLRDCADSMTRRIVAPFVLAAATALTIAAVVVYACTGTMGPLIVNPSSGAAGTVVTTSASGLKPFPARYELFFGGECMTFTGKLLKTITTNASGGWTNVKVTVPKRAHMGQNSLCGIEAYPNAGQTATSHNVFTVV